MFDSTTSTARDETSFDAFADGAFETASTLTTSPKVASALVTAFLFLVQKCSLRDERQETDSDDEMNDGELAPQQLCVHSPTLDSTITCNSGVHVLRLIARYVRIMCLMHDNMTGIFTNVTQVLDYFTNAVECIACSLYEYCFGRFVTSSLPTSMQGWRLSSSTINSTRCLQERVHYWARRITCASRKTTASYSRFYSRPAPRVHR